MCTIYTFCSNMRVTAFYSPFFVNCTQVQIFKTGVKKTEDYSCGVRFQLIYLPTNYAPPSFGMLGKHTSQALEQECVCSNDAPGQSNLNVHTSNTGRDTAIHSAMHSAPCDAQHAKV